MLMKSTPTHRSLLAVVLVGFALTLTACDKAGEAGIEKLIESQGGGNVDLDLDGDKGFSVQTDEGGMSVDADGNFVITDADGKVITGRADADEGGFSVESDEGDFSYATSQELPANWPSEVPRPDALAITTVTSMDSTDGQAFQVAGTTDDVAGFVEDYTAQLRAGGFSSESSVEYDGEENWAAVFDGPYGVVLNVIAFDDDDPVIGLMVLPSSGDE